MEKVLFKIEEQLKSEQIVFTLDILKTAKRFHATVSFLADTGLKEAMEKVIRYNLLFKDFPLNELLASTDVDKIRTACILIFTHVNKKLKLSPYPVRRALPLVEAISRDLNDQLLKVFNGRQLMYMDYADFAVATESCEQVFFTWDEQVRQGIDYFTLSLTIFTQITTTSSLLHRHPHSSKNSHISLVT